VPETKKSTERAWGDTHPGKLRGNNEDRIHCEPEMGIFVVVDGMGGEAAGEVAAQHAVDFITRRLNQETGTVPRRLREAIAGANNEIYRLAQKNPAWQGMACVLTAAVLEDGMLHVGHVGDSRLYKIRKGQISKITSDHSPIGKREESGELSELEAMRHPRRNEVFRDIGSRLHAPDDAEFIDYLQVRFEPDAAFLLCSDGLSDMLTSGEILSSIVRHASSPRDCVADLIAQANATGGKDNVSVIVVTGEEFSANAGANSESQDRAWKAGISKNRVYRAFRRGWGYFLAGLISGLLLSWLWGSRTQHSRAVEEPPPLEPAARVLVVHPASAEFPTIERALETARPGDRVEIGPGEYQEAIRLKEGVDITAHTPGKAILHLTRAVPGTDAAIMADGIREANIAGLVIKAESAAGLPFGIHSLNSAVNFSNLEISGATQAGVYIEGSSAATLAGSYVHTNVGPGILVGGTAAPHIIGNVIYANGLSREHPGPGMFIIDSADPEVRRNVFSGNGAEAIRLRRQELRDRMMDNLFVGPGKSGKGVSVERARP
jgi:PPM family protein phosphatase